MISYAPFWATLKRKGISQYVLQKEYKVSGGVLDRMRKNESITATTINDLCSILECSVSEILEYIPDERDAQKR